MKQIVISLPDKCESLIVTPQFYPGMGDSLYGKTAQLSATPHKEWNKYFFFGEDDVWRDFLGEKIGKQ